MSKTAQRERTAFQMGRADALKGRPFDLKHHFRQYRAGWRDAIQHVSNELIRENAKDHSNEVRMQKLADRIKILTVKMNGLEIAC